MVDITLLGTSALLPLPDRYLSSAFLSFLGHDILFDCGEGTQIAARKAEVRWMQTELIALTHYHGDHIFGLPGFLQTMSSMQRTQKLTITGPGNVEKELAPILQLAGKLPYEIECIQMPEDGLCLPSWPKEASLSAFPTIHRVPSQGYLFSLRRSGKFQAEKARALGIPIQYWSRLQKGERIGEYTPDMVLSEERKGIKVLFSGDTCACDALQEAAADCDLLILDATYAKDEQAEQAIEYGHMTFRQAAEIARNANAGKLLLTHFSQMQTEPSEDLPTAQSVFPETIAGTDGFSITIQYNNSI